MVFLSVTNMHEYANIEALDSSEPTLYDCIYVSKVIIKSYTTGVGLTVGNVIFFRMATQHLVLLPGRVM